MLRESQGVRGTLAGCTPYARAHLRLVFFLRPRRPQPPSPALPKKPRGPARPASGRDERDQQSLNEMNRIRPHCTTLIIVFDVLQRSILTSWTASINRV